MRPSVKAPPPGCSPDKARWRVRPDSGEGAVEPGAVGVELDQPFIDLGALEVVGGARKRLLEAALGRRVVAVEMRAFGPFQRQFERQPPRRAGP